MNYAVWIALAVVFIAVAPAIFRNLRRGKSGGDTATSASTSSSGHRDKDDGDSGDSDGDGGGGDGGGD